MSEQSAGDRLTESGGSAADRPRAATWDWSLVVLLILSLILIVFLTADLWMPRPFSHI
jgi:hypothetical protein